MQVSLSWLKDFLVTPDISIGADKLADELTMRGIPTEIKQEENDPLKSVVVGEILAIEPHPNADRLQVTHVKISESEEPLTIVCGAKNIAVGNRVPIATVGTTLPGDFKIKKSKIRGVESFGMICSASELGISEESDGILQLPRESFIGSPISKLFGKKSDECVFELELTPNRGDCLSVMGIAREAAPILETQLKTPKEIKFRLSNHRTSNIIKLEVENEELCHRYIARVIDQIKVGESPKWIKDRLTSVGIASINNIVDITNYVMWEYGQPLHAFDLRKIQSGELKVGEAKTTFDFEALNGETYRIEPEDLMIFDGNTPVAIAGVMGGANSQVNEDTSSILLESAHFDPVRVRKTAKRLGLLTDSAKRFEKGTDLIAVLQASDRATSLIRDCIDANVYHPPLDSNPTEETGSEILVDMRKIRSISGLKRLGVDKTLELLDSVGIKASKKSINILKVKIPSFRTDLNSSADIVEEAIRLHGYEKIPTDFRLTQAPFSQKMGTSFELEYDMKQCLTRLGFNETIHYSFVSENKLAKYGIKRDNLIRLKNPINEDMGVMRNSLLPSLLETYTKNLTRKQSNVRMFEVAYTYTASAEVETGYREDLTASALLSGNTSFQSWSSQAHQIDFYYVKGLCELILKNYFHVDVDYSAQKDHPLFHPHKSAQITLGGTEIGFLGEVHPFIQMEHLESKEPVYLFELNLSPLKHLYSQTVKYQSLSKFPTIDIDISLLVDKSIPSQNIKKTIEYSGSQLLQNVEVFDVFESESLPIGKKSLGYRLTFGSHDKTLKEDDVSSLKDKILRALEAQFAVQMREA